MEDTFSKLLSNVFSVPDIVLSIGYTRNLFRLPRDLRQFIKLNINKLVRKEIVGKREKKCSALGIKKPEFSSM